MSAGVNRFRLETHDVRVNPRPSILVLDDDENIGAFVRSALPQTFDTEWAPTIEAALAALERSVPDLVIVDIGLQHESGFDLVKQLRAHRHTERVPVVMMTASSDTLDRVRSLRLGADRYLIKPVKAETLRRVVNEMIAARDAMWWSFNLRDEQVKRVRELFFDATTDVPTLAIVVDDLRRVIDAGEGFQVFCLEVEPLFGVAERDHWDAFDLLRREFVRGLRVMVAPILGNDVIVATSHSGANDFYCFVRDGTALRNQTQLARDLERHARSMIRSTSVDPELIDEVAIFVGSALTQPQPLFAPRILYNAVREAKDNAERREARYLNTMRERLIRAVRERTIGTVFQPIIDLNTHRIVGYEALSRGPAGSEIESPEVIFELARDFDLVWDLEALCIRNVEPWIGEVCERGSLFFNLESLFIQQLQQRGSEVFDTFFNCHQNVVIEVTERSAIRDYRTFRRTLHQLKGMGFKIAIDDCGSGYATLEAVAELQPDYLKVGHGLFRNVEHDAIRRRLVDLVARAADTIGAKTIAEAIETPAQLRVCQELGIAEGQGYLFAPPAPWEDIRNWRPK
jgi:EAL domain-containing protein (putative c-di-GMP-specific phosphodiesterase class I)/DNA-binding response OmpR family regulator